MAKKTTTANSPNAEASMSQVFDEIKSASSSVRDAVGAVGSAGAATARLKVEEGRVLASDYSDQAANYVRERPLVTVGVAFAAGWLVSHLLSGSNRAQ